MATPNSHQSTIDETDNTTISCSAVDAPLTIYRRYEDNFEVRAMTVDDIDHILKFYIDEIRLVISRYELETALKSFPASQRGFYVGTIDGQVVGAFVGKIEITNCQLEDTDSQT